MKKTKNYAMPYPEQDDYFNVEDFQDMMISVDDLMKKLSDSGAQISSDAEHLYNQTKAQMDNIQKRMNAFTALKEGSTTGDAELTDIRVAYDGKEYGNAGEAVREQASDIHKALFGAGASIWSKAKSESTKYVAETKGICILNERFTAAGVVAKISRGTFAQNESTLNLDRECSAYIVEFEKNPGTVYMPSAETIKIVSTTKIIFEANGNARCWIPVKKGQYLAVDSTATAYTCESNHVPYMLYNQANKTLECRGFGSTGSIEPVAPYSLALEYKLEYDMDDTGLVKQIDANREAAASLKEDIGNVINTDYEDGYVIDVGGNKNKDDGYKILKIICYKIKSITFANTVIGNQFVNSVSFYDVKNQFISGIKSNSYSHEVYTSSVPDTAYYAIFTCLKSQNVSYQFNTDYVSAFLERTNEIVRDYQNADNNKLDIIRGKNLFDKDKITTGKFLYDNGGVAFNDDYFISDYIQIEGGEQYYIQALSTNGANNVFYDLNKNALDKSYSNHVDNGGFTAPKSAAYICLSGETKTVNNLCFSKGTQEIPYEPYTDYKPIQDAENKIKNLENCMDSILDKKTELQSVFAQTLSASDLINLDVPNIKFEKVISFHANVVSSGEIEISHGQTAWYSSGKIRIDSTSVKYYSFTGQDNLEIELQHGLTISNTISISLNVHGVETMENGMPRIADLIIESNGKIFRTRMKWNGCCEKVQAKIISGNYKNCSLNFWSDGYKKDIWAYGDSYFDYWPLLAKKYGYGNFLCDGVSGRDSVTALKSLKLGLTHGIPKKILWCMGMNDPDSSTAISDAYKTALDEVVEICNNEKIELIITTIPNVPDRNHNYKNKYIMSLGKRVVDVAKAVGADNSANWFDGFLSDDKVHPTGNIGANAIVGCIITNVPELLETN